MSSVGILPLDPDDLVGVSSFLTFIDILFFNKTLDFFDKVVVTFCNLPRQNVGGGAV